MNKGLLIVFEGIDGTGKSTQMSLLARYLREKDLAVIETREPTNGQFGQQIRALYTNRNGVSPEQELELFLNDRLEHVENVLKPALHEGKIILCDRYFLSTAAYQGVVGPSPAVAIPGASDTRPSLAFGHSSSIPGASDTRPSLAFGFSPAEIIAKNDFAPSPDLALLFCAPPRLGIERITKGRGDSLNDFEQEATLQKVAAIFDSLELPYIKRINATGSIASVHQSVLQAVSPLLHSMNQNA
jgi:dTMP kinase